MKDMLGNEVKVGDTVVHFNNLYDVLSVRDKYCRLMLKEPSKTTRPKSSVYYMTVMLVPTEFMKDKNA